MCAALSHRLWSKVQSELKRLKINLLKSDATRVGCHHFECICHPDSAGYKEKDAKGIDTILTHAFTPLAARLRLDVQRFSECCDYFHAKYTKSGGLSDEDQKLVPKLGGEARQRKEKAGIGAPNNFRDTQAASSAGEARQRKEKAGRCPCHLPHCRLPLTHCPHCAPPAPATLLP